MEENIVERDRFAQFVGIRLLEVRPGYAVARVTLTENHLNGLNIVQGGVTYTLADSAFAAAGNAGGAATVNIGANISYFRPPEGGSLTATARLITQTGRLCHYLVEVTDEKGSLTAQMNVTGYCKG